MTREQKDGSKQVKSFSMWNLKTIRKISALNLLIFLALITLYGLWGYVSFFLGAIVFFVLFEPLNYYFRERLKIPKPISAFLIILISIIVIVVPLVTIFLIALNQIQTLLQDGSFVQNLQNLIEDLAPTVNLQEFLQDQIPSLLSSGQNLILSLTASLNYWFIGSMLMYFALYFLLVADRQKLFEAAIQYIPFNRKNSIQILQEFKSVTYAVLISNLLMAIIQGAIFGVAFYLAGVQASIIWAFIAFVLSFLPVVGPILIAVPATGVFLINGDYASAGIMLILAVVLTLNDSFLRPIIQERMGDIHPMVSVAGFIMGIALFGIIGIVVGPVLLSYFLVVLKMFGEEYIEPKETDTEVSIDRLENVKDDTIHAPNSR